MAENNNNRDELGNRDESLGSPIHILSDEVPMTLAEFNRSVPPTHRWDGDPDIVGLARRVTVEYATWSPRGRPANSKEKKGAANGAPKNPEQAEKSEKGA